MVGTAAGGTADWLARLLAQHFSKAFKQNFVVENRTGAGGLIALEYVRAAPPDGYTLVVTGGSQHTILPTLMDNFPYDPVHDLTHIAFLGGPPAVLAVYPGLPVRDLKELVALARSEPGKLSFGSPSTGTHGHLTAEQFKQLSGIEMVHVPYRGANPAITDLVAGHVPVASTTLSSAAAQIHAGKVTALAVTSPKRIESFPNVPTFAELGYADVTSLAWFGLSGPPNLPPQIVQRLNAEAAEMLQQPEVQKRLNAEGVVVPDQLDAAAFTAYIAAELKRWAAVVKASGAKLER